MPSRRSVLTPQYTYDEASHRYRSIATGRWAPNSAVRAALDSAITSAGRDAVRLTQQLRDGGISVRAWKTAMQANIKSAHLAASALASGGWAQMTPAAWGRTGAQLRQQYAYLSRFAAGIANGSVRMDGIMLRRADLYIEAARTTYHQFERREMALRGYLFERNVLAAAEHCDGCLAQTARGWAPIGELVPIGQRQCRSRDKCHIEYSMESA